ncbi:hypothetical protein Tco_1354468 [Tanacetum coccineum]
MANVTSLLTSLCNNFKDSASTSNSGTLPSQTVTNPRQQINAITTRSGKTLEGPSTPLVPTPVVSNPQKEPEQNPETSTEKVQNPNLENTAQVPPPEEEESIFMEIPKPKAKKTVNFTDELAPLDSLPPGNDDSTLKKDFHEENFQVYSNPLFEFDDNFKSSNVNPLFEENDKDVEIKSSSSFTLTSPEESEFEVYLEIDSIPPGIDLTLPPTLEVSSSNPTSPTLTGEKEFFTGTCSISPSSISQFSSSFQAFHSFQFSLQVAILLPLLSPERRKKIICLLATYLHQKPKPLSRPQEVEEIKEKEDEVSSDVPIHTIVMPIRIIFDNPIDFNDQVSKPKDFKKDLTVSFDSSESSILPPPLFDSDSHCGVVG